MYMQLLGLGNAPNITEHLSVASRHRRLYDNGLTRAHDA